MADYIFKNSDKLTELLNKVDLLNSELNATKNTAELRNIIDDQSNSGSVYELLAKFFILKYIYDFVGISFEKYKTAINADLSEILGNNPTDVSLEIQRKSKLKFPFKIWTRRTAIIQFSAIGVWLILLITLHLNYPELWFYTFHLPINGIAIIMFPVLVLILISPRFFGQEKFENIQSLQELVNEVYRLNEAIIYRDNCAFLNEELNKYINEKGLNSNYE